MISSIRDFSSELLHESWMVIGSYVGSSCNFKSNINGILGF